MQSVSKYNLYKGVSTVLTVGTPIVTLLACGEMFVHRSETALSAAGVFTLLLISLFAKDKLASSFKTPSALIVAVAVLVLTLLLENILLPMKYVCVTTIAACGVDELTFKRFYKLLEKKLPESATSYKHIGFLFTTTRKLEGEQRK